MSRREGQLRVSRDFERQATLRLRRQAFYEEFMGRWLRRPQALPGDWRSRAAVAGRAEVVVNGPAAPGIGRAAELLARYLRKFAGWPVPAGVPRVNRIVVRHGGADRLRGRVPDERFSLSVAAEAVNLVAPTVRGAIAGIVCLIQTMELERAPALRLGRSGHRPRFARRICPGVLANSFSYTMNPGAAAEPDPRAFELALLSGANALLVPLDLALLDDGAIVPELGSRANLRRRERLAALAARAAEHGLDLVGHCYNPRLPEKHRLWHAHPEWRGARHTKAGFYTLCSSHGEAIAALGECWARLVGDVPGLAALSWIVGGEGFYHCFMRAEPRGPNGTNCPRCRRADPQRSVAEFANRLARAVHRRRDEVEVFAWPYSGFHWTDDNEQARLIDSLDPKHVAFLTCPEKDSVYDRGGHRTLAWDYSLSCLGPGHRFLAQQRRCRRRGVPFYIKTETSFSWEFHGVYFIPALDRWLERWRTVRAARPKGLITGWYWESAATTSDLGYWAAWASDRELAGVLPRIARSRFGTAGPMVRAGWRRFAAAMSVYPLLAPGYHRGPAFIGAAQPVSVRQAALSDPAFKVLMPFMLEEHPAGTPIDRLPWEPCALDRLSLLTQYIRPHDPDRAPEAVLEQALATASRHWRAGLDCLDRAARARLGSREAADLRRETATAKWIGTVLVTSLNLVSVLRLQARMPKSIPERAELAAPARQLRHRIVATLRAERQNARAALALVTRTPELDFGLRNDVILPRAADLLARKLQLLDEDLRQLAGS